MDNYGFISFTALMMSAAVPQYRYCEPWKFQCGNGKCIGRNKLCDNYEDCGDQSDESYSVCQGNVRCWNKVLSF